MIINSTARISINSSNKNFSEDKQMKRGKCTYLGKKSVCGAASVTREEKHGLPGELLFLPDRE